ncbi:nephrocan-like [Anopheles aquasalis]|uniref:nephrocan-like n=1 Tax=Anopheles aquasalis TaxID=42839 RepID=UPI00215B42B4|nr:nephrocan-like [Anopheles aquasalis]
MLEDRMLLRTCFVLFCIVSASRGQHTIRFACNAPGSGSCTLSVTVTGSPQDRAAASSTKPGEPPISSIVLPAKVSILDLANRRLKQLPANAFHQLLPLEQLLLQGNELQQFDGATIAPTASLKLLNVSANGALSEVRWEPLSNLRTLETVDISGNRLESLFVTRTMKVLRGSANRATTIETDPSNFLFALERAELAGNAFRDLAGLGRFAKLSHLDLSNNRLETVDFGTFRHMRSLTELVLRSNRLFTVTTSPGPSIDHPLLDVVDLSGNYLTALPSANVTGIASVQRLHLEGNGLVLVELHEQLLNWPRLKSITLANNDWTCEMAEWLQAALAKRPTIAIAGDAAEPAKCTHPEQVHRGKLCCRIAGSQPYLDRFIRTRQELQLGKLEALEEVGHSAGPGVTVTGLATAQPDALKEAMRRALLVINKLRLEKKELETTNQQLMRTVEEERTKNRQLETAASSITKRPTDKIDKDVTSNANELQVALERAKTEVQGLKAQLARCTSTVHSRTGQTVIVQ